MKLLIKDRDSTYLQTLKMLLERNGIPAFISGENTARMITPYLFTEPGLWIYLDEQETEALKLIDDPDYEVINRVDVSAFHDSSRDVDEQSEPFTNLLVTILGWAVLVIAGMLLFGKLLQFVATNQ
jgi:hypothetical protein